MRAHPYTTSLYSESLSHWGRPLAVPEWASCVLIRPTESGLDDAAGTYPIAILPENADLEGGLSRLSMHGLVSVVLVLDDFHRPPLDHLVTYFDHVRAYKTHYIHRPAKGPARYSNSRRYQVRAALKSLYVTTFDLKQELIAWMDLYRNLTERHRLVGLHAFPESHHIALSRLCGVEAVGAWAGGKLVCCHIWINYDGRVHSHLMASSQIGYRLGAGYAVNDATLHHFRHAELINFGGGAGLCDHPNDGLAKFKRVFTNETAKSYVVGKVLNHDVYHTLISKRGNNTDIPYFPAYRTLT